MAKKRHRLPAGAIVRMFRRGKSSVGKIARHYKVSYMGVRLLLIRKRELNRLKPPSQR
jgi:hypothetical protein